MDQENEVLMVVAVKYIIFKKIKIRVQRPFNILISHDELKKA